MKKLLMLCMSLLSTAYISAQELGVSDALRYSMDEVEGTARFRAMGGAFGALGGDLSSININPASSAIFNTSNASASLGVYTINNDNSYFGTSNSTSETDLDLNQFGASFVFNNTNANSPWKKFTLSVAYDRTANFNEEWVANGVNPNNTVANYFLNFANGRAIDDISALSGETISEAYAEIGSVLGYENQQAFLGFEGFIFNETADEGVYSSNVAGNDFNQRFALISTGYNGKIAFNFATSYNDRFYFGLNLNAHIINYERTTLFSESNSNTASLIRRIDFDNTLLTTGSGFSFQLGGIAKLTEQFRVGLIYNSPTWYRISEETTQFLGTTRIDNGDTLRAIVNPNVVNIFPEYRLQTPGKLTGSLAYIFGKKGLISFDYAVKDYSNAQFRPTSDVVFSALNTEISNLLDTATSYRVGGEYRHKQWSFRGGYRFEESPYKDGVFIGDLQGYSLGLGYNFGGLTFDIAYSNAQRTTNYQLFSTGLTDTVEIDNTFSDVILTLGFNI